MHPIRDSIRCLTVHQVWKAQQLHSTADVTVNDIPVGNVIIVGNVIKSDSTKETIWYQLNDGTGDLKVRVLKSQPRLPQDIQLNFEHIVRAVGRIKICHGFSGKSYASAGDYRELSIINISLVSDGSAVYHHILQTVFDEHKCRELHVEYLAKHALSEHGDENNSRLSTEPLEDRPSTPVEDDDSEEELEHQLSEKLALTSPSRHKRGGPSDTDIPMEDAEQQPVASVSSLMAHQDPGSPSDTVASNSRLVPTSSPLMDSHLGGVLARHNDAQTSDPLERRDYSPQTSNQGDSPTMEVDPQICPTPLTPRHRRPITPRAPNSEPVPARRRAAHSKDRTRRRTLDIPRKRKKRDPLSRLTENQRAIVIIINEASKASPQATIYPTEGSSSSQESILSVGVSREHIIAHLRRRPDFDERHAREDIEVLLNEAYIYNTFDDHYGVT